MEEIVERHAELVRAYPPPEPKDCIFEKDEPGVRELIDAYYEIENGLTPSEPELPVPRRRLYAWPMSTVQQSQLVSAYHEYFPVFFSTSYESAQRSELHVQGSEDSSSGNSDIDGLASPDDTSSVDAGNGSNAKTREPCGHHCTSKNDYEEHVVKEG